MAEVHPFTKTPLPATGVVDMGEGGERREPGENVRPGFSSPVAELLV
jgi:hypothetical protein